MPSLGSDPNASNVLQIVSVLVTILGFGVKDFRDKRALAHTREEARKDLDARAAEIKHELKLQTMRQQHEAEQRHTEMTQKVDLAISTANNFNTKLASALAGFDRMRTHDQMTDIKETVEDNNERIRHVENTVADDGKD